MSRELCIVLHDVAPETWPRCQSLLAMLDEIGASPATLLVVPDFHGHGRVDESPEFLRALARRCARGDEIALHGYFHRDDSRAPRSPVAWLRRRVLTSGEGEFSELSAEVAASRLRAGVGLLASVGWSVAGFVAPAWLASAGTGAALRDSGLRWTSSHTALIDLRTGRRIMAPCLTASPRSAWRRSASIAWLRAGAWLTSRAAVVRVGLHPADADHPELIACWRSVIVKLLAERQPITKTQAVVGSVNVADAATQAMPASATDMRHGLECISTAPCEAAVR